MRAAGLPLLLIPSTRPLRSAPSPLALWKMYRNGETEGVRGREQSRGLIAYVALGEGPRLMQAGCRRCVYMKDSGGISCIYNSVWGDVTSSVAGR